MKKFDESMIGKKVIFVNHKAHTDMPSSYPPVGTIGTIVSTSSIGTIVSTKGTISIDRPFAIQWEKGTTSGDDLWVVGKESVELLNEDDTQYNSIGFFLHKLTGQLWGKSTTDWVVTSLGSGCDGNDQYWSIAIKNIKTREEKRIKIPCYKD